MVRSLVPYGYRHVILPLWIFNTDRQVSSVEWMNDERLVADVYDSGDSIARVERRRGAGYVLDGSVIVTVFDFLERKQIRY